MRRTRVGRGARAVAIIMLGMCGAVPRITTPSRALAQSVATEANTESITRRTGEALLARRITIHVDHSPLRDVLDAIATQAQVHLIYPVDQVRQVKQPITLHLVNVAVSVAFEKALAGTDMHVEPLRDGSLIIPRVSPDAATQQLGTIVGFVTDAATKQPIAGAVVTIDSAGTSVKTHENGRFAITNVSVGLHRVSARSIGYRVMSLPVTVREGATETVALALMSSTTVLNEVVTTATGDRKRFEVGNAVGTIKADSVVQTNLIRNVSDLLQARVPGVVVSNTDGAVGSPSKIRLRGLSSLSLNNDPIVIVDGVRMNSQTTVANLQTNLGSPMMIGQLQGGGQPARAPSRLDDLDPNTIESIDILRGPSASSLYGTDAANGVIVIKTKRGHAGAWRFTLTGDAGQSQIAGGFPDRWIGWGRQNGNQETGSCLLAAGGTLTVAGGNCHQDSVTHFNPQNDPAMRTLGTGNSQSVSAAVSGGTESLQQFLSAHVASNLGMAKMSDVEQRVIARYWNVAAPSWMVHPNTEQNIDGASRTTFNVSRAIDVSLSTNGIYRTVLNGGSGIQAPSFLGGLSAADTLGYLPSEGQRTKVTSSEQRGTLAATADARPTTWLSITGTGGGDYGLRTDQSDLQAQYCTVAVALVNNASTACPSGHVVSRGETFITTANGAANLSFSPTSWLTLRTALGEQYTHTHFYNMQVGSSSNCSLAFGTTLLTPNPVCPYPSIQQYDVTESRDEAATAGVYLEETITAFGLYYTFGVRRDLASAFGGQVTKSPPNYPKLNLSYPLSEQSFFPKQPYVSSLRLRLAYGQSGNQASQTAVLNNYYGYNLTVNGEQSAVSDIVVGALGNPQLRPEKSAEWEGGADVSFLNNERVHVEFTLYRKFTHDMITSVPLTPSLGVYSLYYNLGNVENRGLEVGLTARLIDRQAMSWEVTLNGSKNTNTLVRKAPTLPAAGPVGTSFVEGYPLYGYWGVPVVSYGDANGNGILEQNEIIYGAQRFMGAPYPKGELTYGSSLALWNGAVRLSATLDQILDQTTLISFGGAIRPRAAVDRTAPLAQQAAFLQAATNSGYIGGSSTTRLNEASVSYNVPVSFVRRLHAQSLAVTLAGRNLGMWSSYVGKDPNVDTSFGLGETPLDSGLGVPQPRSWTLRFNLGL